MPLLVIVLATASADRATELAGEAIRVEVIGEVQSLLERLRRGPPDAVLLQHRAGDRSVLEVLKRIRAVAELPCLLRSIRGEDAELRVLALESGADDCIPAAAAPREVLARLRAVLRRSAHRPAPETHGWRLLAARRELLTPDGDRRSLTAAEFELLRILMQARRDVSRDELFERVFRRAHSPGDRAVDTLVARLRRKLERPGEAPTIKSVRGVGYAFLGFPPPAAPIVENRGTTSDCILSLNSTPDSFTSAPDGARTAERFIGHG